MFKNFSDGAVAATNEREPTTPAVYQAALISNGPPSIANGATNAPSTAVWSAQANCFEPKVPSSYGIDLTNAPVPITAAYAAIIAYYKGNRIIKSFKYI